MRAKGLGLTGPLSIDLRQTPDSELVAATYRRVLGRSIGDEAVLVTSDGLQIAITTPQILGRNDDCGVVASRIECESASRRNRADQHGLFIVDRAHQRHSRQRHRSRYPPTLAR